MLESLSSSGEWDLMARMTGLSAFWRSGHSSTVSSPFSYTIASKLGDQVVITRRTAHSKSIVFSLRNLYWLELCQIQNGMHHRWDIGCFNMKLVEPDQPPEIVTDIACNRKAAAINFYLEVVHGHSVYPRKRIRIRNESSKGYSTRKMSNTVKHSKYTQANIIFNQITIASSTQQPDRLNQIERDIPPSSEKRRYIVKMMK